MARQWKRNFIKGIVVEEYMKKDLYRFNKMFMLIYNFQYPTTMRNPPVHYLPK
jgi:hypothetical protein